MIENPPTCTVHDFSDMTENKTISLVCPVDNKEQSEDPIGDSVKDMIKSAFPETNQVVLHDDHLTTSADLQSIADDDMASPTCTVTLRDSPDRDLEMQMQWSAFSVDDNIQQRDTNDEDNLEQCGHVAKSTPVEVEMIGMT